MAARAVLAAALLLTLALGGDARVTSFTEVVATFTGQCVKDRVDAFWSCRYKAASQHMTTKITPDDGVHWDLQNYFGTTAILLSQIAYVDKTTFVESGNITFGTPQQGVHGLSFRTIGHFGDIIDYPATEQDALSMNGVITGGYGPYEGATGILTYVGLTTNETDGDEVRFVNIIANRKDPDDDDEPPSDDE